MKDCYILFGAAVLGGLVYPKVLSYCRKIEKLLFSEERRDRRLLEKMSEVDEKFNELKEDILKCVKRCDGDKLDCECNTKEDGL